MMRERQGQQEGVVLRVSLKQHVPDTHLLRAIDRFVELDGVRAHLAPSYAPRD